jgi:hypothetical protein
MFHGMCSHYQISFVGGPTQKTPGSAKNGSQNAGNNAIFPDLGGSFGKAQTKRKVTTCHFRAEEVFLLLSLAHALHLSCANTFTHVELG